MRKLVGMIGIFVFLIGWIVIMAAIGAAITEWPRWIQLVFYVVAGIVWVIPMRWVFRWMNANDKPLED